MKVAAASDHAGLELKQWVVEHLRQSGHTVVDLGPASNDSVDYPDFAQKVAQAVRDGQVDRGVLVCGTGVGMSMSANRVPSIRAALCTDEFTARMTRAHNDANVLCLGQRVIGVGVALGIVDAFMSTPFEGGRHAQRVQKMSALETCPTPNVPPEPND